MRLLIQCSVVLILCLIQIHWIYASSGGSSNSGGSLADWMQTSDKSKCMPRDTVVYIGNEYPGSVGERYNPQCVTVKRCGGCCGGDNKVCTSTETANTTVTVMVTAVSSSSGNGASSNFRDISMSEDKKCECREKFTTTPPPTTMPPRR
ncbi:putative vascular endothelial growth factor-like protein [Parapoxvirus red deer/HL953]|uniref:Putative vascular endothelial growth factor-like protein n=3 Tax=Parapoxvirus reddeerpox TaxID=3431391 RepID=A0A0A7MAD4_9POXV